VWVILTWYRLWSQLHTSTLQECQYTYRDGSIKTETKDSCRQKKYVGHVPLAPTHVTNVHQTIDSGAKKLQYEPHRIVALNLLYRTSEIRNTCDPCEHHICDSRQRSYFEFRFPEVLIFMLWLGMGRSSRLVPEAKPREALEPYNDAQGMISIRDGFY